MKAITIRPPFSTFILEGKKTIETRKYRTRHRGDILICVSQTIHEGDCIVDGEVKDCLDVIRDMWLAETPLHLGHAIAVANLVECRSMTRRDEAAAMCQFFPGRIAWVLDNIRPITPFKVRGMPGIFEVEEELIEFITSPGDGAQ